MRFQAHLIVIFMALFLFYGCDWELEEDEPEEVHPFMGEWFLIHRTIDGLFNPSLVYQRYYGWEGVERLDRGIWQPMNLGGGSIEYTPFLWETTDPYYALYNWITYDQVINGRYEISESGMLNLRWTKNGQDVMETYLKRTENTDARLAGYWEVVDATMGDSTWYEMNEGLYNFNTTDAELELAIECVSGLPFKFMTRGGWMIWYGSEIEDHTRWYMNPMTYTISEDGTTLHLYSWMLDDSESTGAATLYNTEIILAKYP